MSGGWELTEVGRSDPRVQVLGHLGHLGQTRDVWHEPDVGDESLRAPRTDAV